MKIIGFIASLLLSFISFSQNSYYFSSPLPSEEEKVNHVDAKWYGSYSSLNQPSKYIIDENGIYLVSTVISSISRETIRENSKYSIRNGYIHGVIEKDSLPCVLEGENYFFGIQNKEILIGLGSQNILTKIDEKGTYILNTYENGKYIPTKIVFAGNSISFYYFDYDFDTKVFKFIHEQKNTGSKDEYKEIILYPTEKEMKKLLRAKIWGGAIVLEKD